MPRSTLPGIARRTASWACGLGGAVLFFLGTASMTSGRTVAGFLPPILALCLGAVAFVAWFVLFLVGNGAVQAKPRRRPR